MLAIVPAAGRGTRIQPLACSKALLPIGARSRAVAEFVLERLVRAFKMPGRVFHDLHALWRARERCDEYVGTLVNAYLAAGGNALGYRTGESYMDAGTVHGYFTALQMFGEPSSERVAPNRASERPRAGGVPRAVL